MKNLILIIAFCSFGIISEINAQVTIGSNSQPNENAVLDLISNGNKGLLLPRLALTATNNPAPLSQHVAGMTVYNTATTSVGNGYDVSRGFYYNDGTKWVSLPLSYTNWFYMPSISFDTSVTGTGFTKDLYQLYYSQFSSPMIISANAPASIPFIPARTDLYYYITKYDPNVFDHISITENGVMTYDIKAAAGDCSFINIVYVLR